MRKAMLGALVALMLPGAAALADDPAFGYWLSGSKRAIVKVEPCASGACGRIVWLAEPLNEAGQPKTDIRNEDEEQRSRALCSLTMVGDFEKAGEGAWEDGFIYNPEDGKTYKAKMEHQDDGTLKVRGYVGISLLGKSQIWTPEEGDRGGC